jgi:hypothetical protein
MLLELENTEDAMLLELEDTEDALLLELVAWLEDELEIELIGVDELLTTCTWLLLARLLLLRLLDEAFEEARLLALMAWLDDELDDSAWLEVLDELELNGADELLEIASWLLVARLLLLAELSFLLSLPPQPDKRIMLINPA